jgi:HlyD family secretion protein
MVCQTVLQEEGAGSGTSAGFADLAQCSEFRQTLLARPPGLVHGTAGLLGLLLGTAVLWAALTEAHLVVRVGGRVRSRTLPQEVVYGTGGEAFRSPAEGRVVAVAVRPGDTVRQGQLLIQLDTEALDNEIAKHQRTIRTGEEELAGLDRLLELAAGQHTAARARAEAELAQARAEIERVQKQQGADIRLARLELAGAEDEVRRLRRLAGQQAAPAADLVKAEIQAGAARERLDRAAIPVPEGQIDVLSRALEQLERDGALRRQELTLKRRGRQGEIEAARVDLAHLQLQRQQAALRAPRDGVVTRGDVQVGDVLARGKAVLEVAEADGFRFEGTIPSEEVGRLGVGLPVRIKLDAFDYQQYGVVTGTVCFIAPDSRSTDEPTSARYLVRIDLDGDEVGRGAWRGRVKLGMAGQAEIVTARESLLWLLLRRLRQSISLG